MGDSVLLTSCWRFLQFLGLDNVAIQSGFLDADEDGLTGCNSHSSLHD
jgi:hypothetical protein